MADVIEFLERMGRDAQLRHASEAVLEQAMRDAHLSPSARAALMCGDRADIEAAIGADGRVSGIVWVPDAPGTQEPKSPKAVIGIDEKVCCMVNVPLPEGDEESDDGKHRKAA